MPSPPKNLLNKGYLLQIDQFSPEQLGIAGFILLLLILNPVYSLPTPGYFQQQVDYYIQVELFTELNRLECREEITYHNYSPDTLPYLFFHLYINRFKPTQLEE